MKKELALLFLGLFLFSFSSAAMVTRTINTQVTPGQQFSVEYNAEDSVYPWYLTIQDTVTGGCTPTTYVDNLFSTTSSNKLIKVYTAPNLNTTCTFVGYYMFSNSAQTNIPDSSIQVGEIPITQSIYTSNCYDSSERCNGSQIEQCLNNTWINQGNIVGKCGVVNGTISSDCLYTVKGYCIKDWYLLVAIGILTLFAFSRSNK